MRPTTHDAAVEEGEDCVLDGAAPEAVAPLEALLPRALHLVVALVDEGVEGRFPRASRAIDGDRVARQEEVLLPDKDEKRSADLALETQDRDPAVETGGVTVP
jgi:hypothetical protein